MATKETAIGDGSGCVGKRKWSDDHYGVENSDKIKRMINSGDRKIKFTDNVATHNRMIVESAASPSSSGSMPSPIFATHKMRIIPLSDSVNVYDFQLKDHLRTTNNIYLKNRLCTCAHTHNKLRCPFVESPYCKKCNVTNELYLDYRSLMFHQDLSRFELATCCVHTHTPPCRMCINCRTMSTDQTETSTCIVQQQFECVHTTDAICMKHESDPEGRFVKTVPHIETLSEHLYNIRNPLFYVCKTHSHKHRVPPNEECSNAMRFYIESTTCYIQAHKCCDSAIFVTDYNCSFVLTMVKDNPKKRNSGVNKNNKIFLKPGDSDKIVIDSASQQLCIHEYIIFDPRLWREQSKNHFISLVRAVINMPDKVKERYQRFEASNFIISNIKRYKSGKQSVVRSSIIGYETRGIYQTSTISCVLPYNVILLPQSLYDMLINLNYDLQYVALKRDPSIKQTCLFVCRALRNPDPHVETVVIPDAIAKPLNQDQDGDKNGVYILPLTVRGYQRSEAFVHKLAKMELSEAYGKKLTTDGRPRLSFSENNLLLMNRHAGELRRHEFFKKTYDLSERIMLDSGYDVRERSNFMIEVGCGYLHKEFDDFCHELIRLNARPDTHSMVTADDLLLLTQKLGSIIKSGAKGHEESLVALMINMHSTDSLYKKRKEMIDQLNRYIASSQELSHSGREGFSLHYAAHDIIVMLGHIFLNKYHIADYNDFASIGTFVFNQSSLDVFIHDLEQLPSNMSN